VKIIFSPDGKLVIDTSHMAKQNAEYTIIKAVIL